MDKCCLLPSPKIKIYKAVLTATITAGFENGIVFGCAGLKQTLSSGIDTSNLGLFMFGEVCTVNGHSDFGNLMLSKIIFNEK